MVVQNPKMPRRRHRGTCLIAAPSILSCILPGLKPDSATDMSTTPRHPNACSVARRRTSALRLLQWVLVALTLFSCLLSGTAVAGSWSATDGIGGYDGPVLRQPSPAHTCARLVGGQGQLCEIELETEDEGDGPACPREAVAAGARALLPKRHFRTVVGVGANTAPLYTGVARLCGHFARGPPALRQ